MLSGGLPEAWDSCACSLPVEQHLALPASLSPWLLEGACGAFQSLQPVAGAQLQPPQRLAVLCGLLAWKVSGLGIRWECRSLAWFEPLAFRVWTGL